MRNGDAVAVARAATAAASHIAAHATAGAAARATAAVLPPKLGSGVAPQLEVHMSQRHVPVTAACVTESTAAMASAHATAVALPHHPDDPPPREPCKNLPEMAQCLENMLKSGRFVEPFCQGCHEDWCDTAFVACAFVTAACVTEATVLAVADAAASTAAQITCVTVTATEVAAEQ